MDSKLFQQHARLFITFKYFCNFRFSFGNLFSGGASGAGGEDQLGPYAVNMRYDGGGSGGEGESVGPALATMRNKSASARRAAGGRGGTDLYDGDTL